MLISFGFREGGSKTIPFILCRKQTSYFPPSKERSLGNVCNLRTAYIESLHHPSFHTSCSHLAWDTEDADSLYHVFTDLKKAIDRVWQAALWATMKKYNISTNLIQVIKNLYNKAISAVLFNSDRDVYSHLPSSTYF